MNPDGRAVHHLTIARIHRETEDAVTVTFDDPDRSVGGSAGQYVIARVVIAGEEHRRVFSLSSTPELGQAPSITAKRLPAGLVSTHFVVQARVGDVVGIEPAAGDYRVGISAGNRRTYYAFGAGSGIVPIMSMLRGVLCIESESVIHLAYGNRRAEDVIFAAELSDLEAANPDRLRVTHVLSREGNRIDYRFVDRFLIQNPPLMGDVWYLLCGPPGMNRTVEARLRSLGVMDDRLLVEHYVPPDRDRAPAPYDGARVRVEGEERWVVAPAGEVLLTTLGRTAAPILHACRSGVCGTCKARLVAGAVDPGVPFALTEEEQASGMILTCVARPLSAEVVLRPPG